MGLRCSISTHWDIGEGASQSLKNSAAQDLTPPETSFLSQSSGADRREPRKESESDDKNLAARLSVRDNLSR